MERRLLTGIALIFLCFVFPAGSSAATKTFTGTGNFGSASNWNGSALPAAGDDLVINGSCTIENNVATDNVQYGTLTIGGASAGTLSWAASGTNRLNVSNVSSSFSGSSLDMTNGGTLVIRGTLSSTNLSFTPGTGTIERQQGGVTMTAYPNFHHLIINTGGTISSGRAISLSGNLTISSGTLSLGAYNFSVAGTTTVNGTLVIGSATGTRTFNNVTIGGTFNNSANDSVSVTGNFQNNGTLAAGSGTYTFNGSSAQSISGTSACTFANLALSNPAGLTLLQHLSISNSLALASGPLRLNSKTLTIANSAGTAITRTGGCIVSESTDNSGKVTWNIAANEGEHVFPFATTAGTYVPFTLNLTAGNIGNVTVSTYATAANNTPLPATPTAVTNLDYAGGGDNSANTVDRFWQIDKDGASGTATLTFTASSAEVGSITNLQAQRWNSVSSNWDAPIAGQSSSALSATVPGVTSFSPWTMSGNNAPLPIELVSLDAAAEEHAVKLKWITATETNNDFFTIEKTQDGVNYTEVMRVDGAGNSVTMLSYSATDLHPYEGTSYYRLRQTDFNGDYSYSNFVAVNVTGERASSFTAYPNPCSGEQVSIRLEAEEDQEIRVLISDVTGSIRFSQTFIAEEDGAGVFLLEPQEQLKPGIYIVNAISQGKTYSNKLIVE